MTINIIDFLTRVAFDLNETDNNFPTGAWTRAEMVEYLNYSEKDFLKRTGILKVNVLETLPAGSTILCTRPTSIMDIDRIGFNGKHCRRQTSNNFEMEDRDWRQKTTGRPTYWHEDHLPNTQLELNKIPAAGGIIRYIGDYLYAPYVSPFENIHLKDSWEPYLRWKVLSLALIKDGDNKDIGRSQYAQQRYLLGVRLARRLVTGTADLKIQR
jgi:hypothetical protein